MNYKLCNSVDHCLPSCEFIQGLNFVWICWKIKTEMIVRESIVVISVWTSECWSRIHSHINSDQKEKKLFWMKFRVHNYWFVFGGVLCVHIFWTRSIYQLIPLPLHPTYCFLGDHVKYKSDNGAVLQWRPVILRIECILRKVFASCTTPSSHRVPARLGTVVSSLCSAFCRDWPCCWHALPQLLSRSPPCSIHTWAYGHCPSSKAQMPWETSQPLVHIWLHLSLCSLSSAWYSLALCPLPLQCVLENWAFLWFVFVLLMACVLHHILETCFLLGSHRGPQACEAVLYGTQASILKAFGVSFVASICPWPWIFILCIWRAYKVNAMLSSFSFF